MKTHLLLLLCILPCLLSCGKIAEPKFEGIENFKVKRIGLSGTEVGFNVIFFNPNNFGLNVKEAGCDVYLDSVYMGKFSQDTLVSVGKQSKFTVALSGSIPMATALKVDITKYLNKPVNYKANGSVKVGKAGVYVSKPFELQGTYKIQM